MFGNCKFLRIWMNVNLHLLRFSDPTTPHKIWKSSLKWVFTPNRIFVSYMHPYTPISMWNPQLYKSPVRNPCSSGSEESSDLWISHLLPNMRSQPRQTQHEIVRFGPRSRVRTSQEITHLSSALAWACLTPEFLRFLGLHDFKRPHAKLIRCLTYKPKVERWIFLMWANGDSPFEARGWQATPCG